MNILEIIKENNKEFDNAFEHEILEVRKENADYMSYPNDIKKFNKKSLLKILKAIVENGNKEKMSNGVLIKDQETLKAIDSILYPLRVAINKLEEELAN